MHHDVHTSKFTDKLSIEKDRIKFALENMKHNQEVPTRYLKRLEMHATRKEEGYIRKYKFSWTCIFLSLPLGYIIHVRQIFSSQNQSESGISIQQRWPPCASSHDRVFALVGRRLKILLFLRLLLTDLHHLTTIPGVQIPVVCIEHYGKYSCQGS